MPGAQFFNILRIILTLLVASLILPVLILIEIYHSLFTGRFRKFDGQTVLVTGAGNGLGRELALQLARKNCTVLCVDMRKDDVIETVKEIEGGNIGRAKAYVCDITDCDAVAELRDSIIQEFEKIDLLINNAAFLYLMPLSQGTNEHFRRCIDVNILGATWMTRAFLPSMQKQRSGQIVFINSYGGIATEINMCAYNMTKAALLAMAWSLRQELDSNPEWKDIKVSSALPFFTATHPAYVHVFRNNLSILTVNYTASAVLENARRGFTEFAIPGGQFATRMIFLGTKVLPRSFTKFLAPSLGVEMGVLEDETLFDKLASPDQSMRSGEEIKGDPFYVKFSSGERKKISLYC